MNLSTRALLTARQRQLTRRRGELLTEMHAAETAAREVGAAYDRADRRDAAKADAESQLLGTQEERDRSELAQVEAALQRLGAGAYGLCADCAEPIPLARLRVQPAALRCADCEQAHEVAA